MSISWTLFNISDVSDFNTEEIVQTAFVELTYVFEENSEDKF